MSVRSFAFAAWLAVLLAGCVAGPNYQRSAAAIANTPAANGAFHSGIGPGFVQAALPDHWWRLYHDPALDGYVTEALAANTDLRAADANLKRASFVVREAEAGSSVQTTISGGASAARLGGYTSALGAAYTYSLGSGVSYPLDLAGGIRRGIEAARDGADIAKAMRDQVRVVIAAATARSYAAACSANATLVATRHVVGIQRRTLTITQRLQRGGRGTAFDVTRAQAALNLSIAAIPTIQASRQAALYELAALMGRAPAEYPRPAERCVAAPVLRQALPIGDGDALLRRRPDIRAAERNLAAATATIGVETAALYPQVQLGGSLGTAAPLSSALTGTSFGFSLGPLISWGFPNRLVAHARIAQAGAAAQAAAAQFDGTVVDALRQIETALSDYARQIDRHRALRAARSDAERATAQADMLYRFGRTSFIDLLAAQANLASAEAGFAQSRATLVDRQIDVFLTLGGGWGAPTADAELPDRTN